jgi:O-antigen/teichoic acid export membrane protein
MSKPFTLATGAVKSGFNLFWGAVVCTIISSIEIIVIARLLLPSDYGLYSIALTVPNLIKTFRDLGIDQSTIRYTARYKEENQTIEVKTVLAATATFEILFGTILSLVTFLLSDFIGNNLLNRPDIVNLIQISSIIILADALLKTAQSAFIGYEKMHYTSLILITNATLEIVIIPLLLIFGLAAYGAVLGFTVTYLLAGIIAFLLFYKKIYKQLRIQMKKREIVPKLKAMLRYGLPLSASSILDAFLLRFYSFLIAIYTTDALIGNYQVAGSFAVLFASLFLTPLKTSLFPTFSKINAKQEIKTLEVIFQSSVKYASFIIIPATVAIMVLSKPAVSTFFGDAYQYTPLYLTLFVITYLYTAIGYYNTDNLINSQGKTTVNFTLQLVKTMLGISLCLLLVPPYGILGLIATSSISMLSMIVLSLYWIKKNFGVTVDWSSSGKILASSAIAAVPTYFISLQLILPNWISLLIGLAIFLATYTIAVSFIGAINKKDTQNLREVLKALGPLGAVIATPLNVVEFIIAKTIAGKKEN